MKKQFGKKDVLKLLIKKASGFYYEEEIYEYEKPQNKSQNTVKNVNNLLNYSFFDNPDMVETGLKTDGVTIKTSDGTQKEKPENLTLVKKKTSTHYIPPDMLAIKILLEIYGKEVDENNVETMTDQELINLKNQLIQELMDGNSKTN